MKTRGTANQACSGLMAKNEVGYPFLFFTLLSERANFNMVALGSAQQNISQQIVKDQKIVIPPSGIALDFKKKIEPLFDTITLNITESRTIATIRDTLLPKLLSGELSVDAIENNKRAGRAIK
jgi:type I restriction enzyme S subunit